jgi:glutamine amidotransferase
VSDPIAVIDIGSGNLRSVEKAIAKVGGSPVVTGDPDVVRRAPRVVMPGQGAFGHFAGAIKERGLEQALHEFIASGRPYLGICLGLQVLYEESEEHGPVAGLGLLPGKVVRFPDPDPAGPLKVPHMGWNQVRVHGDPDPLLAGIPDEAYFYFVHSYYVAPDDRDTVALTCEYGVEFAAAVRRDNLFACQFHPEKSQKHGLQLLANFVEAS